MKDNQIACRILGGAALLCGLVACGSAEDGGDWEAGGASDGAAAGPGTLSVEPAPEASPVAPVDAADTPPDARTSASGVQDTPLENAPRGVVLENGRVITEEEARTGLTPKAAVHESTRFEGPVFASSIPLRPTSSHVCVLTLVWGTLYGHGEASVYMESGTWRLASRRPSNSAGYPKAVAEGTCFPHSAFMTNNPTILMSDNIGVTFTSGTGQKSTLMWWGDAASALTGVAGKFFGAGERAWIEQSNVPDLSSSIWMATKQGGVHSASGFSYFVGTPGGTHVAQFIGPGGVGSAAVAGEYVHNYDGREGPFHLGPKRMAHTSEAMCYFTRLEGRFNGGDEWAHIYPDSNGYWTLDTQAREGTEGRVTARARCFRFRQ